MHKAMFFKRIDVGSRKGKSIARYWMKFEGNLPFQPRAEDCFFIGPQREEIAETVHYDLLQSSYVIVCEGSLCDDEKAVQEMVVVAIKNGWDIDKEF